MGPSRHLIGVAAAGFWFALTILETSATGQTYEDLLRQNEALKARVRALEEASARSVLRDVAAEPSRVAVDDDPHEAGEHSSHDDDHDAGQDRGRGHADEEWVWEDPYYPGWWRPSDEYRPNSWMSPPSEGFFRDLFVGQFVETHRSSSGTPWVHPFTIEPPQLHRDLFMFYKYTKDAEGTTTDEHELEIHLDWAITRRFGILVAAPYLGLIGPDDQATGFGDMEIAPRVVLVESERFFLATNIFITVPTGDETLDLGAGETNIAPYLTTWHDLGSWAPWTNWNTAYLNVGPEIGVNSGETTMAYSAVFAHSFLGPKLIFPHHHGNGHGSRNGNGHNGHQEHNGHGGGRNGAFGEHWTGTISPIGPGYPPGMTSVVLEFNGQSELFDDRVTYLQLLAGLSYIMTDSAELRFGINFPLNRIDEQMDAQYILGMSYIF